MELFRALGSLLEAPCPKNKLIGDVLGFGTVPDEPTHSDLFLFQLYPYASVFLGDEGRIGGEAQDRVAGFWRAMQSDPPQEPDHLATLLAAYSQLIDADETAEGAKDSMAWRRVRHACLWEHLLSWVLPFLTKLRQIAPPFYRAWADTLEVALAKESALLGPPKRTPLALREAKTLPDPRTKDAVSFLAGLLCPVRSGLVLTRADLARAARDLGLGLRVGERAYILKAMMSQGPGETLDWLASEARDWERLHEQSSAIAPEVADFWVRRARNTCELLGELRTEVLDKRDVVPVGVLPN